MKPFEKTLAEIKVYLGSEYEEFETIMRELVQLRNTSDKRLSITRTSHSPELAYGPDPGWKLVGRYKLTDSSIINAAKEHLKSKAI